MPTFQGVNHITHLGADSKLAEDTLKPIVHDTDKAVKNSGPNNDS